MLILDWEIVMSDEKMREEFEAWYRSARRSAYDEPDLGMDKMSQYFDTHAHESWVTWKASRAAIEVELREAYRKGWDASGEGWNAEYPGDCHLKDSWLRDREVYLGLKVKP